MAWFLLGRCFMMTAPSFLDHVWFHMPGSSLPNCFPQSAQQVLLLRGVRIPILLFFPLTGHSNPSDITTSKEFAARFQGDPHNWHGGMKCKLTADVLLVWNQGLDFVFGRTYSEFLFRQEMPLRTWHRSGLSLCLSWSSMAPWTSLWSQTAPGTCSKLYL